MSNETKLSRRRFLKAAAVLGVLGAGGAALWHMGLSRLKDFGLPRTAQVIYAERLRQIVAEDNGRGRTIMWDLVVPLENQVLELRLPREDRARRAPRTPGRGGLSACEGQSSSQYPRRIAARAHESRR